MTEIDSNDKQRAVGLDFNDINSKLVRLRQSLGEMSDKDVASNVVDEHKIDGRGQFEHSTTFGTNDATKNVNAVMTAIHLIGSLKDIIKSKMNEAGKDPKLYEQLIDSSLPLSLITDLDNKDKHGTPLQRKERSNKDPKITDIHQALRGTGITKVSGTTDFITGKTTINSTEGNVRIIITAVVNDGHGEPIMPLHEMIEQSIGTIDDFVSMHGLVN